MATLRLNRPGRADSVKTGNQGFRIQTSVNTFFVAIFVFFLYFWDFSAFFGNENQQTKWLVVGRSPLKNNEIFSHGPKPS